MNDGYSDLAFAILVWDLVSAEGAPRHQVIAAETKLKERAAALREQGYNVSWKEE